MLLQVYTFTEFTFIKQSRTKCWKQPG